jgi:hypothetical protein
MTNALADLNRPTSSLMEVLKTPRHAIHGARAATAWCSSPPSGGSNANRDQLATYYGVHNTERPGPLRVDGPGLSSCRTRQPQQLA